MPCKLFVGCLPIKPEATKEELQDYFGPFGEISDTYIPQPYRGFGFVTFQDGNVVQKVLSQTHRLRHSTLNITHADPKGTPRGTTTVQPGSNYGYGYGSQFYNPQQAQPQGVYFGYGAPQAAQQYSYGRGYTPQTPQAAGFTQGAAPRPQMSPVSQPHMEQYQQQQMPANDVPPPAKRPHQGQGGQHMGEVHSGGHEQHYAHYGQAGEGVGGVGYGNGNRYRGGGGGGGGSWPQ